MPLPTKTTKASKATKTTKASKAAKTSKPKEVARKRRHVIRPDIRQQLLDAAEIVIRDEGYAAATVRRIATEAGLKHQAVFYYFGTQDELLLALYRRAAESYRERLQVALNSDRPLRAMWDLISDPDVTSLGLEFMALANHNDDIRKEMASMSESFRALEAEAVKRHLEQRGIEPRLSPELVSVLTNALARLLVQEATLGIHAGHDEAKALVDASLSNFEARGEADLDEMEAVVGAISSTD